VEFWVQVARGRDVHQIPFPFFPLSPSAPPSPSLLCDLFFNRISSAHFGTWQMMKTVQNVGNGFFLSTHLFGFGSRSQAFISRLTKRPKVLTKSIYLQNVKQNTYKLGAWWDSYFPTFQYFSTLAKYSRSKNRKTGRTKRTRLVELTAG
jgi:hypothetical protein